MTLRLWADEPVFDEDPKLTGASNEVSRHWEAAAYPIGNGRLGCTVFGNPSVERIQFNQESLWVGNEHNTGAYQPFGDIYIATGREEFSDYRRELDIERALQTISYQSGNTRFTREYFASYPAQVIMMRFSADQPGALTGTISMGNLHDIPISVEDDTLVMKGDTSGFWYWCEHLADPDRRLSGREYASDEIIPLDFEARVKVIPQGGSVVIDENRLAFAACDMVTLILAADTNYVADRARGWRGEHPHARVTDQISNAVQQGWEALFAAHVADYQGLFKRVTIDLGDSPDGVAELPTQERVERYTKDFSMKQQPADQRLEVLLYQYARYLMISCSRPGHGALPANLQGIWCIRKRPSWRCDFHTDVNIQMNYWFTSAANLLDCFEPLAHWIDSIREVRREETRKVLGVERGWLMRSENGIFGGSTWHFQKGDSAWLCQNLWDHYTFTQDREYLERYAYPVMKEISEFWIDHLKELADGTLVAPEGRSPEHGPVGVDGVTYDQVLCWDLFNNTIEASETLGIDPGFRAELIDRRNRLLAPQIGRWGQLQEWMEDIDDPQDDHRHINHLICVYPGRQVHPTSTPELAEAARISLTARRDHGQKHPGWSRVWKACMFARLLNGDDAYEQLSETLATHVYGNLWAVHPPFQIDCNFGYAAGLNETLVQSHMGYIHLLPALPKAWASGKVTGLRVRGGFELDLEWRKGSLVRAVLRGINNRTSEVAVRYMDQTRNLMVDQGQECILTGQDW